MAEKYTLRKFLVFKALIHREEDPIMAVDSYLQKNPKLDPYQVKTWEQWNEQFRNLRLVEDVPVSEAFL